MDHDQSIDIADRLNGRIIQWKVGAITGQVVAGRNGLGSQSNQLNEVTDVYLDEKTNKLVICDWGNR